MTSQEISKSIFSQMALHVPLCLIETPKRLLILGDFIDHTIVDEMKRHEPIEAVTILSARPAHFDLPETILWKEGSVGALIETLEGGFDAVVDLRNQKPNREEARVLLSKMSANGVLVRAFGKLEAESLRAYEACRYVMPYGFSSLLPTDGSIGGFILASKRPHPTADLKIQKADMLEGCSYYSVDIHEAAFALPPVLFDQLGDALKL